MKLEVRLLKIINIFVIGVLLLAMVSCTKKTYFDDEKIKYSSSIKDMGGVNTLSLIQNNDQITLENAKVRIILNANGSINEYANKEARLYLTKNNSSANPLTIEYLDGQTTQDYLRVDKFIEEDSIELKKVSFAYLFDTTYITTYVSLKKDSSEVEFSLEISGNNLSNPILDVEYPIVEGIDELENKQREYFVSPYATGYIFKNPLDNFNDTYFGINKKIGMYPSGWYYPMQFSAYYSEGIGGFYWQTKDEKDSIKSFTFTGNENKLRLGIWHYLNDYQKENYLFDYTTTISNMTKGTKYEAADIYKKWATKQAWVSKGKAINRTDINKELFEQTSLAVFGYRSTTSSWKDCLSIYDMYANVIDGKFFNISIYHAKSYMDIVKEYEGIYSCFEFNSLAANGGKFDSSAMKNQNGEKAIFNVGSTPNYYICASDQEWLNDRLKQDINYLNTFGAKALYFDVDYATMHPIMCFDSSHAHGTRVNVGREFYEQYKQASDLMEQYQLYSVGGEMITEQLLPYFDYYQARANGSLASYMEHDLIRPYIEMGIAEIVPYFTYIYHEYGALRLDGFLVPDEQLSNTFYHTAALTALTGGIVEYNYEYYYPLSTLPTSSDISLPMLEYTNKLGQARLTYGKNYLVYGDMVVAPNLGTKKSTYEFNNPNYTPRTCNNLLTLSGEESLNDVVTSAFRFNNKIGIFLSNITNKDITVNFILHTFRDYGIDNGEVYLVSSINGKKKSIGKIKNGKAKISIDLLEKEVYMLEIVEK